MVLRTAVGVTDGLRPYSWTVGQFAIETNTFVEPCLDDGIGLTSTKCFFNKCFFN